MWRSKDDFVRDLASLNDFGAPGDLEPFKVFYSNGRGSRIKKRQETTAKFTDTRTGEVIHADGINLSVEDKCQSKGRGRLLSGFSSAKFQLEKQLRLAKPMGSNDEAIVSYFRKNRQTENCTQSNSQTIDIDSKVLSPIKYQSKLTVKATRNSNSQKNALMDALLSKSEESKEVKKSETTPNQSAIKSHSSEGKNNQTIKDTLENDGSLKKFKAEMRTKIMDILNAETTAEKPHLPKETLLLNELIREYLTWNGYKYTKSVFVQESGLSSEPISRSQLLDELGVCDTDDSSKLSILHGLVSTFKEDANNDGLLNK